MVRISAPALIPGRWLCSIEFADAFEKADELVLAEIYAAREKNIYKISSAQLADKIKESHPDKKVTFMQDFNSIADYVEGSADKGDLVLTMGSRRYL